MRPSLGSPPFARFGGAAAIAAAILGFAYSIAFVVVREPLVYSLLLLAGALATSAAVIAFADRVRAVDPGFATWGMVLGLGGTLGAGIHGAYDLANAIHPVAGGPTDLPSAVDPRGFLTFGIAGVGLLVLAWLASRDSTFPRSLGWLGLATGALLVAVYLARLIVLDSSSPLVLGPAALAGLIAIPAFYVWLGRELLRDSR
ncbi:MAG TPA: hypothetical protein VGQ47_03625 [Candidatus Limnocylindrales bacterium]|nr:hypothetical protein [Candidatus Limnocylindrales bacterium]